MNVLFILLPIALLLLLTMVVLFVRAARRGEFDDLDTPAHRMLFDDLEKDIPKERKELWEMHK